MFKKSKGTPAGSGGVMKFLDCPFEVKDLTETGTFKGYVSVYGNVDLGGDVVERGAFKEMELTKDGQLRILYQHDQRSPIGKARVSNDSTGLMLDGSLVLEMPQARTAHAGMKAGILDGLSIGYDILKDGAHYTGDVRHLTGLKLWEGSVVTFGMNPLARIETVKAVHSITTIREFEDYLRDAGFSAAAAKSIASAGFKERTELQPRDAGDEVKKLAATIAAVHVPGTSPGLKGLLEMVEGMKAE